MALHRKSTEENPIELNPLYSQGGEAGHAPRHTLPGGRARPRRRVPARARRADARRQLAAQPRHVRHHVDGAAGAEAHVRDVRQEHDRQGRVPAHRRDRDALRQHAQPAVELARHRAGDRHVDHRLERGRHARRHGAQVALARPPEGRGQADRQAQHGHGLQRPGLLGEVLPLLGRRGPSRADGG